MTGAPGDAAIPIRPLVPEDLQRVWLLHEEGNDDVAAQEPLLPNVTDSESATLFADRVREELDTAGHHHLVAGEADACVGWGHAYIVVEPDGSRVGYVSAVYVDRSARRKGVGSALLDALVRHLQGQSLHRIQLMTPSRSAARALWLKRGFRPLLETMVFEPPPPR